MCWNRRSLGAAERLGAGIALTLTLVTILEDVLRGGEGDWDEIWT